MACHTRSNSFPSRSHPLASNFEEHLRKLRSSSSIFRRLTGLQDLHDCVDKVLSLPLTQQALAQEQQKKWVVRYVKLLDMSSIAKDALLQTKECVQGLLSALRRRRGDEISSEVKKFLASRKAVKKTIKKAFRNLMKACSPCNINEEHEMITMLREVETVTFTVFESLLSLIIITGPKAQSKLSGWSSLVSKLVQPKRVACEEEESNINEFEKMDVGLSSFITHKSTTSKLDNIVHVQNQLKELESSIQDLEEGLECLSRPLIKNRVSLLNILNH
ncbi:hypothetical protein JRO89_XS02G0008000 [Xanthoceras sorbifolium]|uniref:Uncharacterized protein n=1 Tax=Xanthoceras sorbifolium TaxID=99658 RepID=A0ABQ8IDV8_9ROSI|nr:hypothetical protein JRO89_XS02G0008000 [Xanthoceras sorbifolium]